MSQDPSWLNLNPDPHDINSSNLFYNAQEQQISLTPVYSREEFSQVLSLLPAQHPNIDLSYLRRLEGFKDLVDHKEKIAELPDLQEYASEEVFLNRLGQELNQNGQSMVDSKKTSSFIVDFNNNAKNSECESENSEPLCKDYKSMIPQNISEYDYREKIETVLKKRIFTFSNFLSELKNELLLNNKSSISRKELEKDTMKEALKTLENLFKYYKLVQKQTNCDDITLFAIQKDGEFNVSILKSVDKYKKTLLASGKNVYKNFALYFALNSFFDTHLARSFRSINEVYEEIRKKDKTFSNEHKSFINEEEEAKGLDLVSQDLLNEIDNYK